MYSKRTTLISEYNTYINSNFQGLLGGKMISKFSFIWNIEFREDLKSETALKQPSNQ